MKDILIVIDMQKDFIDGSLGTKEAEAIVNNVKKKVDEYIEAGHVVFFTRDTHFENYLNTFEGKYLPVVHCVKDTDGWAISDKLNVDSEKVRVVDKFTFGYVGWDEWREIGKAKNYEICGLCTDICVISNALILRALYPDKCIEVDSKCCAGVTPELHEAALKVMASNQIEIV